MPSRRLCLKKQAHLLLVLSLTIFLSAGNFPRKAHAQQGSAAGDDQRLAEFEQSLDALRQQYRIPGLSAAIVNNGQIIWQGGFGFQDVENQIPATPDTPYRTASLTKTFASMLLMRCVEQGALNLDAPIRNYTPVLESGVTVRHLFTHTSQGRPPGQNYIYSGDRYDYLTRVVESCRSQSFREALAKTILDRIEMLDSVPGQDMEFPSPAAAALFTPETLERYKQVIQRLAKPYVIDNSGRPVLSTYPNRGISAAVGLISTVRELARYDAAIDHHNMLAAQTQEQAWTNHVNSRGQKLPYALGWFVQNYRGERLIWHYGYWNTFSGLFLKVPGRNITLILLANSSGLSAPFSNALGGVGDVTGSPFATLFLRMLDDPNAFKSNPVDGDRFFVRQQYNDFLNREPDVSGFDFWTDHLGSCGGEQQCIEGKRVNASAAFFLSIEFRQTGYLVYRLYKAAYGDLPGAPVPIRLHEFLPDTQRIGRGVVVNQNAWEQVLENNKHSFTSEFVQRPRFSAAYPDAMSPGQFVDQLFTNAGVTPSANERRAAIEEFGTADATADKDARARALRRVAENSTLAQRELNRAFVLMQYFGYLRRNPQDSPELTLDFQGYNFWLAKLNEFGGDFAAAEMVKAFLVSSEYQRRFNR